MTPPIPDNSTITSGLGYLKHHVILLVLVVLLASGAIYGVETIISKHDSANAARADQIATQTSAQNALIQKQTADQIAQLSTQNAQLSTQIAALTQSIINRDAALIQLQAQVKNMQPPALAAEWPKYVKSGTVSALPDGVKLDLPAAQDTLQQLESVPVLQADKQNLIDANQKQSVQLVNSALQLSAAQTALKSETDARSADAKSCQADKTALKAEARKGKLKWLFIGAVVGFVARGFSGI